MISRKVNRHPDPGNLREVVVTDAAVVTALGENLQATWQRILAGETSIRPVTRFPVKNYTSGFAACIPDLGYSEGGSMMRPLLDRLLSGIAPVPPDSLLLTATTKAGIDNLEKLRRGKPVEIGDISLLSVSQLVSKRLGLTKQGFNASAACASSAVAVAQGAGMIALGRAEAILICCVDLVTEFTFSGFSALRALSPFPCRPFDRDRQGLSLGEGAAALVLMSKDRAMKEGRLPLGGLVGWGIAGDASHITAPDREGCGLIQAVSQALKTAALGPGEITAIGAHGTGTVYNDLMELTAFAKVFGKRTVPLYSVKGAIGHSLGATGGIEIALGLQALSAQILPPTVGLVHPMEEAKGAVSPGPCSISGDLLLTTNSGFGGINAALVLGRPGPGEGI